MNSIHIQNYLSLLNVIFKANLLCIDHYETLFLKADTTFLPCQIYDIVTKMEQNTCLPTNYTVKKLHGCLNILC